MDPSSTTRLTVSVATFNVEAQLFGACTIMAVWADSGLITATWDVQVRCCCERGQAAYLLVAYAILLSCSKGAGGCEPLARAAGCLPALASLGGPMGVSKWHLCGPCGIIHSPLGLCRRPCRRGPSPFPPLQALEHRDYSLAGLQLEGMTGRLANDLVT